MTMFWLTAGALCLGSFMALFLGVMRSRHPEAGAVGSEGDGPEGGGPEPVELQVYRDQLAEVERDAARGLVSAEETARLRLEISRRILEADRSRAQNLARHGRGKAGPGAPGAAASRLGLGGAVGLIGLAVAGSVWLYQSRLGAPGYADLPLAARIAATEAARAARPGQAEAEADMPPAAPVQVDAEFQGLMDKLRGTVASRPDDLRGQELLARNEARLGNFAAAHAAQAQVIRLKGSAATAEDHAAQAEMLIFAAGGYVSPEAEAALQTALGLDAHNGTARFYSGLMLVQGGRPDLAFPIWRDLLEQSPPDAPWVVPIRKDIVQIAGLAGVRYELPQGAESALPGALPGPDAAAIEAAAGMEAGDRQAMIEGMVAQLNDRLAREGGTAAEWARLIGALGVLGQTERAAAIHAEAKTRFAGRAEDLAILQAAADRAGLGKDGVAP